MAKITVPKGWFERELGNVATIAFSSVDKLINADETPVRVCNYTDVYYNRRITPQLKLRSGTVSPEELARFQIRAGDVLITKDSEDPQDIAVPALVVEATPDMVCGYHLAIIRPDPKQLEGSFLAEFLQYHPTRHYFYRFANGVTRFGLPTTVIKNTQLLLPAVTEQKRIAEVLHKWSTSLDNIAQLIKLKRRLRRTLIQELIGGYLRFPEFIDQPRQKVRLGDVMDKIAEPIAPGIDEMYRQIGIRSHGKGIFHKQPVTGASLGHKRVFRVVPGCLTLNIIFAWERAHWLYWAPEQRARGGSRDADKRTDVYQLGKMLYEMLTNSDPTLMDFTSVAPGLTHIIRKATRDLPAERYQTVGELIDAIKVHQLASDPKSHPLAVFEAALSNIKDKLERHEYREKEVRKLLAIFSLPAIRAEPEQVLELFDRIPEMILQICAEELEDDFLPTLEAYVTALDAVVSGKRWSYAEIVAKKMKPIFGAPSDSSQLKSLAIEAVLLSAERLGRFAAIDVFNQMLPDVEDEHDAFAVAEMLRRRANEYRRVCDGIPAIKLHPAIRAVREELMAKRKNANARHQNEQLDRE